MNSIKAKTKSVSYERTDKSPAITPIEYSGLQEAYDHFNGEPFNGQLPDVLITYQRKAHSLGYFAADRFSSRTEKFAKHELALNPDGFIDKTDKQICQTLVHEQVHVWQKAHGKPASRGYHNTEWAAKMKTIGLQPSSTGMVGGKETGQRMSDYVIPGGPFERTFTKLAAAGWKLNLQSAPRPGQKGGVNSKTKFSCPTCGQNVWGKPDTMVLCMDCFTEQNADSTFEYRGAMMLSASEPVPTVTSYEITKPSVEEPAMRKRGRPKNKANIRPDRTNDTGENLRSAPNLQHFLVTNDVVTSAPPCSKRSADKIGVSMSL